MRVAIALILIIKHVMYQRNRILKTTLTYAIMPTGKMI